MSSRPSVRETIAAARARLAQEQARSKSVRGGAEDERQAFVGSGIPGVKKSALAQRRQTDVEILGHAQKSIKSLIANAKGSGTMNLSSRDLTEVPLEIWNMYHVDPDKIVVDFNSSGSAWYDAVDLTRFIAADNKITFIDARIQEFGALVTVDLRNNELTSLPEEFSQLGRLASLNISSNKFSELPPVLFSLNTLMDLQLGNNQLSGRLDSAMGQLTKLESLDLSGNQLTELPGELEQLKAIRKLNLSKNKLQSLPASVLARMPKLNELEISHNQLFCLFDGVGDIAGGDEAFVLPSLTRLDARNSGIENIADMDVKISLPAVKEILLGQNNLSNLGQLLLGTPQLYMLDIRANKFTGLPFGVLDLAELRNFDMASNRMEQIPTELGSMIDLTTFVWEGNPIRNVPRSTTTTDALMKLLRQRQELDFPTAVDTARVEALAVSSPSATSPATSRSMTPIQHGPTASRSASMSARTAATPPTNVSPKQPAQNLNLTKKALKEVSLNEILEACTAPQVAVLDFNAFTTFPKALEEAAAMTLNKISIRHNKITEFPFTLSFPFLVTLDISDNAITTLGSATDESGALDRFPNLNELNLTANRLTELPIWLPKAFPNLKTLNASRNKIVVLEPKSLEGLVSVDLSGNEIATLPPLLGNVRSIKTLSLDNNLFRVPRRQIMDQGTEAVMEYLRGRIPV
ncbi:hypothetical protein EMPS_11393 [Entomortierella parvispora]|uniref:Disease resistance R13L4/SHOC-2-like LRR domain-containing protein n=1 Tax=Entomortierella parvispora TaxID=205924 RepID=A0A9P3HLN6_9FUNG|nr:hypothetical protein EMPS_11393 [Entomortierella parvispora]